MTEGKAPFSTVRPSVRWTATILFALLWVGGPAALYSYGAAEYRAVRQKYEGYSRGEPITEPDPEIGFRLTRGGQSLFHVRGTDRYVASSANPQGLRVPPEDRGTVVASADVVAVGGSFTYGHGVAAEEAYPAVAARVSGRAVVNAGVQAYGTVGALLALQRLAALRPDVVTYGFIPPHLRRNLTPCAPTLTPVCRAQAHVGFGANGPEIRPPADSGWTERLTQILLTGLDEPEGLADGWRGIAMLLGKAVSQASRPAAAAETPENEEAALAFLLRRMKAAAESMGARLVVVHIPQPLPQDSEPRTVIAPPAALLRALPPDVELVDVTPSVMALPPDVPLRLSPRDGHPGAAVHQVIGELLGRRLASLTAR